MQKIGFFPPLSSFYTASKAHWPGSSLYLPTFGQWRGFRENNTTINQKKEGRQRKIIRLWPQSCIPVQDALTRHSGNSWLHLSCCNWWLRDQSHHTYSTSLWCSLSECAQTLHKNSTSAHPHGHNHEPDDLVCHNCSNTVPVLFSAPCSPWQCGHLYRSYSRHLPEDHNPWQDDQTHHNGNRCLEEMRKQTGSLCHGFSFHDHDLLQ